jgi:hypothetical protein
MILKFVIGFALIFLGSELLDVYKDGWDWEKMLGIFLAVMAGFIVAF